MSLEAINSQCRCDALTNSVGHEATDGRSGSFVGSNVPPHERIDGRNDWLGSKDLFSSVNRVTMR